MEESLQKHHDCEALMKQVMLMLDGEMSEQQEKEFMNNICNCTHCLESFHIEKSFKECICNGIKRKSIPDSVLNSIREKIKSQLDA